MAGQAGFWTLTELAGETGLAPRTIRYYIARGLLKGPAIAGRGAVYSAEHRERLDTIKELQASGMMLSEIARVLDGPAESKELPPPVQWESYALADDVTVQVRTGVAPWRAKAIRNALREFAARLADKDATSDASDENDY
ncbi:MAG: helix-turn-helix domain-containing protein [Acidobacteria bacterium]|nr:helix-turn-helix domain-containing protein [Acidobacteriota bacterium]